MHFNMYWFSIAEWQSIKSLVAYYNISLLFHVSLCQESKHNLA